MLTRPNAYSLFNAPYVIKAILHMLILYSVFLLYFPQKTTLRQPDTSSEKEPSVSPKDVIPEEKDETPKEVELDQNQRNDNPAIEEDPGM